MSHPDRPLPSVKPKHDVGIVIRCFNEERHIGRLLSGILKQSVNGAEILVVDSGSTDATLSIARRYPVRILEIAQQDFTFGGALNLGCSALNAEFLVFASAHVYPVYTDWLERLLAPFADSQVALSYGKQRGTSTTKFSEEQIFRQWFPDQAPAATANAFCNNANAAIRRGLWERYPFDAELTGLEDLDWARRVIDDGYRIAYAPQAQVIHVHEESWKQTHNRYFREAYALKKIYPDEHFSRLDLIGLYLKNVLADCRAAVSENRFQHVLPSIFAFRWAQLYGGYRGFRQGAIPTDLKRRFYYPPEERGGGAAAAVGNGGKIDYADHQHETDH